MRVSATRLRSSAIRAVSVGVVLAGLGQGRPELASWRRRTSSRLAESLRTIGRGRRDDGLVHVEVGHAVAAERAHQHLREPGVRALVGVERRRARHRRRCRSCRRPRRASGGWPGARGCDPRTCRGDGWPCRCRPPVGPRSGRARVSSAVAARSRAAGVAEAGPVGDVGRLGGVVVGARHGYRPKAGRQPRVGHRRWATPGCRGHGAGTGGRRGRDGRRDRARGRSRDGREGRHHGQGRREASGVRAHGPSILPESPPPWVHPLGSAPVNGPLTGDAPFDDVLGEIGPIDGWLTDAQARLLWDSAGVLRRRPGHRRDRQLPGTLDRRAGPGVGSRASSSRPSIPMPAPTEVPRRSRGKEVEAEGDSQAFLRNLEAAGVRDRVTYLRRWSHDALAEHDGPIDLLYIDGAHRFTPGPRRHPSVGCPGGARAGRS